MGQVQIRRTNIRQQLNEMLWRLAGVIFGQADNISLTPENFFFSRIFPSADKLL
jgi:hypothetical protein